MNKSKGWLWAFIALVVVVVVLVVLWIVGTFSSSYYAVYLNTGDLYFGKLSPFSDTLSNAWYIQRDAQSQSLGLADFSKVAWGAEGTIKLNDKNVVWMAQLSDKSPIVPVLKGEAPATPQGAAPQQQTQTPAPQSEKSTSTSSR
ncbi:MAG: hypothetical protein M1320_00440 [Patescibacteria group bacterium]|nr:hypothetical protein [Patescibacteria group bacterium]